MMIYHFYQIKKWNLKKVKKLVANLYDKTEYVIHIQKFKQVSNQGLILKKDL